MNSAGVAHVGTVEQTTEEDLDRIYAVNVKGVYNCLKLGVAAMKGRGGAILNIASVAATVGIPDRFAYSMSKGAVLTMTLSVARDYIAAEDPLQLHLAGARAHAVRRRLPRARTIPGREAEMFDQLVAAPSRSAGWARPSEIAELALFLCSDAAAFITGQQLPHRRRLRHPQDVIDETDSLWCRRALSVPACMLRRWPAHRRLRVRRGLRRGVLRRRRPRAARALGRRARARARPPSAPTCASVRRSAGRARSSASGSTTATTRRSRAWPSPPSRSSSSRRRARSSGRTTT